MQRDAWSLTLSNRQTLAIAQQQVVEYLTQVKAYVVPDSNPDCQQLVIWREKIVPLWGVNPFFSLEPEQTHQHVLIMSYLDQDSAGLIALSLKNPPLLISVADEDQCEPSSSQRGYWKQALLASFQLQGSPVPIVDFAKLAQA